MYARAQVAMYFCNAWDQTAMSSHDNERASHSEVCDVCEVCEVCNVIYARYVMYVYVYMYVCMQESASHSGPPMRPAGHLHKAITHASVLQRLQ